MTMQHEDDPSSSRADGEDVTSTSSQADTTSGDGAGGELAGDDPATSPAGSPEEQIEAARREAAENFDRFLRTKADLENLVKRHQRELAERARYDGEALARDVLSAVDDLERALQHAADDATGGVSGGVELVLKGLLAALQRNGVERIDAAGKPFDPAEHEAVSMVESADVPPGTVMDVFRAGYKMRDRLLRAAMVSVSRAPQAND